MPVEKIQEIVKSATALELRFAEEALTVDLMDGMTSARMKQYICFTADYLLVQLNAPKLYNAENTFEFMNNISVDKKSNFLEVKVNDYIKVGAIGTDIVRALDFDENIDE